MLLQDFVYLDEMSHFGRERIPERVVHAKGAGMLNFATLKHVKTYMSHLFTYNCIHFLCVIFLGAFGYFEVTHDITKYSKAKVFSSIGKRTPIAIRCSTVGGESGSADTVR